MDGELGSQRKVVMAIVGNEEVHAFYARFGFLPKSVMLEQGQSGGETRLGQTYLTRWHYRT